MDVADEAQSLAFGLVPQILPTIAGVSVYRWEINIRETTILGLVGAGGIGMALQASIDALAWSRVSVILLVILSTVVVAEWASARVRKGLARVSIVEFTTVAMRPGSAKRCRPRPPC